MLGGKEVQGLKGNNRSINNICQSESFLRLHKAQGREEGSLWLQLGHGCLPATQLPLSVSL